MLCHCDYIIHIHNASSAACALHPFHCRIVCQNRTDPLPFLPVDYGRRADRARNSIRNKTQFCPQHRHRCSNGKCVAPSTGLSARARACRGWRLPAHATEPFHRPYCELCTQRKKTAHIIRAFAPAHKIAPSCIDDPDEVHART